MSESVIKKRKFKLNASYLSIYATVAIFMLFFIFGSIMYKGFFHFRLFLICS